jgi:hypothetical protein
MKKKIVNAADHEGNHTFIRVMRGIQYIMEFFFSRSTIQCHVAEERAGARGEEEEKFAWKTMKHEIYECAFLMPLPTAAATADADSNSAAAAAAVSHACISYREDANRIAQKCK